MKSEIFGIKSPEKVCQDAKCPFHGKVNVKKEFLKGRIIKKDVYHSATIEWQGPYFVPKYERYELRRSRLRVHNPPCIDANIGDEVLVARTRPLSKTKNHLIIQLLAKGTGIIEPTEEKEELKKKKLPKQDTGETKDEKSTEK